MKKTADVVIIGGGVQGCSIAYNLARQGCTDVVVLEKNTLASGSTGKSCGVIRTHYSQEILMRMTHESMKTFGSFDEDMGHESGFVVNGLVFLGTTEETEVLRDVTAMQQRLGIRAELVSPESVPKYHPDMTLDGVDLASYEPDAGFADAYSVTVGFAAAARRLGIEIKEGVEVTGIELKGNRIDAVITDKGRISTRIVVNAAGPWAGRIYDMVGIDLPLFVMRLQEAIMRPTKEYPLSLPTIFDERILAYHRPETGGFLIFGGGVIESQVIDDPDNYKEKPDAEWIEHVASTLIETMTAADDMRFVRGWGGPITVTPDFNPILGPVDQVEGLIAANGFSGHGFKISPMVGKCLAEVIIEGEAKSIDITPLRPSRYEEGEPLHSKYERGALQ